MIRRGTCHMAKVQHFPLVERAPTGIDVGGGVHLLVLIALGETDDVHDGASASGLFGVIVENMVHPGAFLCTEMVGSDLVRHSNPARDTKVVNHNFPGGEDKAVGPLMEGTFGLVSDCQLLDGVAGERGAFMGRGLAFAQCGGGHGGENWDVHGNEDSGSGIIHTRDQPSQDNEP